MARTQEIATQIASLTELLEIVAALRAIAAVQMQQSQRSIDAIRNYADIIRNALMEAATLVPADGDRAAAGAIVHRGLVVFCSEHGFCGAFNQPLIEAATQAVRKDPAIELIFVGTRGAQRAAERGIASTLTLPMATHSGAVTAAAHRLAAALYSRLLSGALTNAEAIFIRESAGQRPSLVTLQLFPLEVPPGKQASAAIPPLVNVKPRRLLDEIASEYMFAILEAAAMDSFASENAARFRTMEAAHENISGKTKELNRNLRRMRQEAITTEILDLIGGFEAMKRG
jgi:F-type H+-transporting ATPase subunit gamma